jgi:toxin ParE1/3/4
MRDYTIAPLARRDISAAYRYIAKNNFPAADRWLSDLYDRFRLIAQNAEMGQLRPDLMLDLRSMSFGNYILFFRQRTSSTEIVRIIHGSRDISKIFQGK